MTNVVRFERPRQAPPALTFCEFRLNEDCSLLLTLFDDAGNRISLDYPLGWSPPDFDLDRLRQAWAAWRGNTTCAS